MRMVLVIFWLILGTVATGQLGPGTSRFGIAEAGELVTVESIDVSGDSSLSRDLILSALGLHQGERLGREDLDAHLVEAERRLNALGYYKTVDLQLQKGSARGRFRVVVHLTAESPAYVGMSDATRLEPGTIPGASSRARTDHTEVFGGTRSFSDLGLHAELSASQDLVRDTSASNNSKARTVEGQAIVLWPDIAGTAAYAWIGNSYSRSTYDSHYSYDQPNYFYHQDAATDSLSDFVYGVTGVRHGFATAELDAGRGHFKSHYSNRSTSTFQPADSGLSSTFDEWLTFFGAALTYSEKTGLAAVEPGTNLRLQYNRTLQAGKKLLGPQYQAVAQHTTIIGGSQALTPSLLGDYDWSSGGDVTRPQSLVRTYDAGLIYECVLPKNVILGVEHAMVGVVDLHQIRDPAQRTTVSLRYVSPSLIGSLAFSYGPQGLTYLQDPFQTSRLNAP